MVDHTGHRVINEKGSGKDMIEIQLKQPNSMLFLVLDKKSFKGFANRVKRNGVVRRRSQSVPRHQRHQGSDLHQGQYLGRSREDRRH